MQTVQSICTKPRVYLRYRDTALNFVFNIYHGHGYLSFDMYLPASTHFINLIFFILLVFLLSM